MAKLSIKHLSKYYGSTKVLENINITASDGEFLVLVGPSGSGKTTILRAIAGLEEISSGEIEINNKVINNLPPKDRDIAMVFQNYALYPHMTVYENLAFPLTMKKVKKEEIDRAVNDTSTLLGIKHYLKKKPKELSGGERQRVALGRAIIRNPKLFLMDEPLSNLDAKLRTQMRAELLKLHKTLSSTVIYVTHDQIEALTMGNKIVVLNKGQIQQIGTPYEVYNNPTNIFVAGFIGSPQMNFFDFKINSNSECFFLGERTNVIIQEKLLKIFLEKKLQNKELILGIRPDSLLQKTGSSPENMIQFQAKIDLHEMLGSEHIVYGTTFKMPINTSFAIKTSGKLNLNQEETITVLVDPNKSIYFEKDSGNRIYP